MRYFAEEDGSVTGRYTPGLAQQGAPGISHGGVLFTILDEAMGKAVWTAGHRCLTATAEIRFLQAARLDEELRIHAWVEEADERGTVEARAEALRPNGKAVARTSGRFRPAPRELAYPENG